MIVQFQGDSFCAKLQIYTIKCWLAMLNVSYAYGEQEWRGSESTRLPLMWPGIYSRTPVIMICGLSLLLVLVFTLRGFCPGTPVFPSPQKPTLLNSNLIWKVPPISSLR